jgi:hypothetical protein
MLMEEPCRALGLLRSLTPSRSLLELPALYGFALLYTLLSAAVFYGREQTYIVIAVLAYVFYLASCLAASLTLRYWANGLSRITGGKLEFSVTAIMAPPLYAYELAKMVEKLYGVARDLGVESRVRPRYLAPTSLTLSLLTLGLHTVVLATLASSVLEGIVGYLDERCRGGHAVRIQDGPAET